MRGAPAGTRYRSWRWGAHVECFLLDCRRYRDDDEARLWSALMRLYFGGDLSAATVLTECPAEAELRGRSPAAWLAGARFDGLSGESDPLIGSHAPRADGSPTDAFSMSVAQGPDLRISGLPTFVTVVGGAYFFLPGIRALRYLAKVSP